MWVDHQRWARYVRILRVLTWRCYSIPLWWHSGCYYGVFEYNCDEFEYHCGDNFDAIVVSSSTNVMNLRTTMVTLLMPLMWLWVSSWWLSSSLWWICVSTWWSLCVLLWWWYGYHCVNIMYHRGNFAYQSYTQDIILIIMNTTVATLYHYKTVVLFNFLSQHCHTGIRSIRSPVEEASYAASKNVFEVDGWSCRVITSIHEWIMSRYVLAKD